MRQQGVPTPAELIVADDDMKDALTEAIDSPTPLITHRYPDRVLFITTAMCSMYCRHCTRRRIVGEHEDAVHDRTSRTPSPTSAATPRCATSCSAAATR